MLVVEFFAGLALVFAIGYAIGYIFKLNPNRDIKGMKNIKNVEKNFKEPELNEKWSE